MTGLPTMREWLELSSQAIQVLAVIIIVLSIVLGLLRFLLQMARGGADAYQTYKVLLGRSLLLALEFMVAADVIRTVLLDLTAKGLEILAGLVVIRTFLSWSVTVELEGRWPWQSPQSDAPPREKEARNDRQAILKSSIGCDPTDHERSGLSQQTSAVKMAA